MRVIDALIYLPPVRDTSRWLHACSLYCQLNGYKVLAIVTRWDDIVHYLRSGFLGVVVAGDPGQLPRDRLPRIECVNEQQRDDVPISQQRPSRR